MSKDDSRPKIVVIMPAYNAAKTLRMTYLELPHDVVDLVLLVDDASSDETVEVARQLNLELFIHNRNYGYGGNQKTCYAEALKAQADIIVMVHPDYQYDPTCLPQVIEPLQRGTADVVLGSRLMGVSPMKQGMPWWKYLGNRFLTAVENGAFGLRLSDTTRAIVPSAGRSSRRYTSRSTQTGSSSIRKSSRKSSRRSSESLKCPCRRGTFRRPLQPASSQVRSTALAFSGWSSGTRFTTTAWCRRRGLKL